MTQIFSAKMDRRLRRLLLAAPIIAVLLLGLGFYQSRSDAHWGVGKTAEQPIPFRHDIHAGELGLACGFCHQGGTEAAAAGMPSASTCLTCHSKIWRGVEALQPLFTSVELNQSIEWTSLYRLPEHTRFHHGAHAASGVGCTACHGDVAGMAKLKKAEPMSMAWCLDCHRKVGEQRQQKALRALTFGHSRESGNPTSSSSLGSAERDSAFRGSDDGGFIEAKEIAFATPRLTDCSTCHY